LIPAAKELGVPFSCEVGVCGSCLVDIVEGNENLSEPSDNEKVLCGDTKKRRLLCQCSIKQGEVTVRF